MCSNFDRNNTNEKKEKICVLSEKIKFLNTIILNITTEIFSQ